MSADLDAETARMLEDQARAQRLERAEQMERLERRMLAEGLRPEADDVYVSGPIKGHADFLEKFAAASAEVAIWANPVNPTAIPCCEASPCVYPGEMLDTGHTWQCYMRHDIERMVHCDGIYMMRGWELSKGATEELRICQMLGMPVYFQPLTPEHDLVTMLHTQRDWSEATFGPGARLGGILEHIGKELDEIRQTPGDVTEWIDVAILALDGAWRAGFSPEQIVEALQAKYAKNRARVWPDWRTASEDQAIEHVR